MKNRMPSGYNFLGEKGTILIGLEMASLQQLRLRAMRGIELTEASFDRGLGFGQSRFPPTLQEVDLDLSMLGDVSFGRTEDRVCEQPFLPRRFL